MKLFGNVIINKQQANMSTTANQPTVNGRVGGYSSVQEQKKYAETRLKNLQRKIERMPKKKVSPQLTEDAWAWGMFCQTLDVLKFIDEDS